MKVWIVNHNAIPPSFGGLVRHYYFAKYLLSKGHTVKIFTSGTIHNSGRNLVEKGELHSEKTIDSVPYVFIRSHGYTKNDIHRIINFLNFPINLLRVCWRFGMPDVIYTSSPDIFGAFGAMLLARKKKIPCILEIRDLWPESVVCVLNWSPQNPIIKAMYLLEKWMYKTADALIFTFEGGKDYIVEKHWEKEVDLSKIYYVNNGVDLEEFDNDCINFQLDDPDLEDNGYFNVIYAGSIRKANDVGKIVECAECLMDHGDIRFLIYGTGTELEELKEYCLKKKITNIKFKGYIEKKYIPFVLSKSNLNLLNYQSTGLQRYGDSQNKLFDYFASGRPILSNVAHNYSLVEQYHCGITKNLGTAQEYAEAILYFYNLPEKDYRAMCENARKAARSYDYKKLGEEIEKILLKVKI